jgi:hypothetical protein
MPKIRRLRALSLLANSADGRTEARLLSRGFTREEISGLIRDGLATASTVRVGRTPVEVVRVQITEAGRAALARGDRFSSWKQRTAGSGRAILSR